jgi:hypothetical protein
VARGSPCPLILAADRQSVFHSLHGLAYPGIWAARRLLSSRVMWPHMVSDIAAWFHDCQACNRAKVTKQSSVAVSSIPVPASGFSRLHVDLVGPLPTSSEGWSYLVTIIKRLTIWLEAIRLHDVSLYRGSPSTLDHKVRSPGHHHLQKRKPVCFSGVNFRVQAPWHQAHQEDRFLTA